MAYSIHIPVKKTDPITMPIATHMPMMKHRARENLISYSMLWSQSVSFFIGLNLRLTPHRKAFATLHGTRLDITPLCWTSLFLN